MKLYVLKYSAFGSYQEEHGIGGLKMSLLRSLCVWLITYSAQCYVGFSNHWHLNSTDYYIFYVVATVMMVISYVTGRIEDIRNTGDDNND